MHSRQLWLPLVLLSGLTSGVLSGCVYSVANAGIKASAINKMENREKFEKALGAGYQRYLEEAETSGCAAREYTVSNSVFQFIESEGDDQMEATQQKMKSIYKDKSYSAASRAEAVYYLALINMRPSTANHWLAEDYVTILKTEFPGDRDCISDWLMDRIVKENPEDYK
jgi:hypothetical protein